MRAEVLGYYAMKPYVALLRGVNVSGKRIVPMSRLKRILLDAGFHDVTTFLNSGNVVFRAWDADSTRAVALIEEVIEDEFGFHVKVLVLSIREVRQILGKCPFVEGTSGKSGKVYVTFLSSVPRPAAVAKLRLVSDETDEIAISGKAVYLLARRGYASTTFNNNFIERILQVEATTRNTNTLRKIVELGLGPQ